MSEKLEVGSIVEGKVVRIKPFGAIVSLGNTQGRAGAYLADCEQLCAGYQ